MKRLILCVVLLAPAVPANGLAWECVEDWRLPGAIREAGLIFSGWMIGSTVPNQPHRNTRWFEFRVTRVWKGAPAETLRVVAGWPFGFTRFGEGPEWLVYARQWKRFEGMCTVGECSRTRELHDAWADMHHLPAAAWALDDTPLPRLSLDAVIDSLSAPSVVTRLHACRELGEWGGEWDIIVPRLIEAIESGDPRVQVAAANALGRIGTPAAAAIPVLERYVEPDSAKWPKPFANAIRRILPVNHAERRKAPRE